MILSLSNIKSFKESAATMSVLNDMAKDDGSCREYRRDLETMKMKKNGRLLPSSHV